MVARRRKLARFAIVLAAFILTGCAEFAQRRLGRSDEGPPSADPPLYIAEPPVAVADAGPPAVKQARFEPTTPTTPTAAKDTAPTAGNPFRAIYAKAAQRYQTMDTYIMRLRRREVVAGKNRPEELILVKFRQEPWSVYFKWVGPEAKGREVIYVKGKPGNEIHTLTAAGDVPLLPAGQRFSINADSPLVKSKSRYPITEAGLGTTIRKFGVIVEGAEKGDPTQGTLKYLGRVKRPEFDAPVEGVEQTVPRQTDPHLPSGGRRWWYFDTTLGMPALILTVDDTGREVEYYCHDRIQTPARLDDDDFNPDKLWKKTPAPGL